MIASKLKLVSILLFLLSILIGNGVIQAKVEESITFPSFVNFKPNASSVVLCMTTDADGQIWMGTDLSFMMAIVITLCLEVQIFKPSSIQ